MLIALVAAVPPTFAALAAWWGVRGGPAWRDRVERQLDDVLTWQVEHAREHRTDLLSLQRDDRARSRRFGGQQ